MRLICALLEGIEPLREFHSFKEKAEHFRLQETLTCLAILIYLRFHALGIPTECHFGAFDKDFQEFVECEMATKLLRKIIGTISYVRNVESSFVLLFYTWFLPLLGDGIDVERESIVYSIICVLCMLECLVCGTLTQQAGADVVVTEELK